MKKRSLYKLNNLAITLIFCIGIFTPFAIGIIQEDKDVSGSEKRKLSKSPQVPTNAKNLKEFPKLFDNYYSDHFGLRDWFVKHYKIAKYGIGDSPSKDVVIGKDGWLFLGSIKKGYSRYFDPIGDVRNTNLYSKEQLMEVSSHMNGLKSWLDDRGIEYVLVIAPNKHTIYFEQLPDYIYKVNEQSATDQLVEHLDEYTDITVVDLRSSLIEEKQNYQLYYKTDTHWNHYAANIAQYEIMKKIETLFPGRIKPELNKLIDGTRNKGDLAGFIDVGTFEDIDPQPIFNKACKPERQPKHATGTETHTLVCSDQELNAIIFRDSFFIALTPYFARKFKRSTHIWKRLDYPTLETYVELEDPDVIIEEWVERILPYVPESANSTLPE